MAHCRDALGKPKERFRSEKAARKALRHKRYFKDKHEWPNIYHCPECKGFHYGHGLLQ